MDGTGTDILIFSKGQFILPFEAGNSLSLPHLLPFPDAAHEQLSLFVRLTQIFLQGPWRMVSIAVNAAVAAGIVSADINAFITAAAFPLPFIRLKAELSAQDFLQHRLIDTGGPSRKAPP